MTSVPIPVLEIGGTHISAAVVDPRDWTVAQLRRTAVDASAAADDILATFVRAGAALNTPVDAVWGIAMPDPFDYASGVAAFRDVGKFDALYGLDIGAALCAGLPQRPSACVFRNDADLFILGEWTRGAAEGNRRCVGITLGTGIGSGWLVDGRIAVDAPGMPELGRARTLTVDGEGLEEVVSTRGIRRAYRGAGGDDADVEEIAARASSGDDRAVTAFRHVGAVLGRGIGPSLQRFGAEIVVLGGSIARSWSLLEPSFRTGLAWPQAPPIVAAHSPEDAALRGAARVTLG